MLDALSAVNMHVLVAMPHVLNNSVDVNASTWPTFEAELLGNMSMIMNHPAVAGYAPQKLVDCHNFAKINVSANACVCARMHVCVCVCVCVCLCICVCKLIGDCSYYICDDCASGSPSVQRNRTVIVEIMRRHDPYHLIYGASFHACSQLCHV
jgi:hypothetical protein